MLKIKLQGVEKVSRGIDRYIKKVNDVIDAELSNMAQKVVSNAESAAPEFIRPEIAYIGENAKYTISTTSNLSAYIEFGTGNYAKALLSSYPTEWVDMARTFYINGLGRTPAMPYLYPSYNTNKTITINNIIERIEKL